MNEQYLIFYLVGAILTFGGKLVTLSDKKRDAEIITKEATNYATFWPLYLVRFLLNIFLPY